MSQNLYDKATKAVEWIVEEVIRRRNWLALLLLVDVIVFVALNPLQWPFANLLAVFPPLKEFEWYTPIFWSTIIVIFLLAVVVAARAKKKKTEQPSPQKLSAIKGLLPFEHSDEEIFSHLQRGANIKECQQAINDAQWRFGILCGESGAGKTSFLQAGLWPALERDKSRCVYVKFSDLDPFESVKQACIEHLSPEEKITDSDDLATVIRKAAKKDSSTLVLIFDQFEQFFVHQKRKKDREPFVEALKHWFTQQQTLRVKILIGIRGDFLDRLNELQKEMKYSLGPMQSFRLEKFEPEQATEVFCYIAEKENLSYNRAFIATVNRDELADAEDGLISPVDIQVLAWMVVAQTDEESRAFNRTAFQKLGGVEGLLERYLTRALAARETQSRRQAAIEVLLALIDQERNTRAGALTIEALRKKLENRLSEADLKDAVEWLSRGDVRLIVSPSEDKEKEPLDKEKKAKQEGAKYELAHERIIPAVLKVANKQLEPVARANRLLISRVNEWSGNERDSRYLFSLREMRLIKRHKPLIAWGKDRRLKEDLLAASRKRLRWLFALAYIPILLFTAGWFVWDTNWWQIYLIKRELRDYASRLNDDQALAEIAKAYAVSGDFQFASQVLNRINDESSKAYALSSIAASFARLGEITKDRALLEEVLKIASEKINDEFFKASALSFIADSFARLGESTKDKTIIKESFSLVEKVSNDQGRFTILEAITTSEIAAQNVQSLRALVSHFNTDAGRAKALARILAVYSRPELIKEEAEGEDEEED